MEERRRLERFELSTPARVQLESGKGKAEYNLTTRDVSSGGAFLYSPQPLPEGAKVKMEFLISLETLQKLAGENGTAQVRVKGKVIRSDSNGVAIRFENGYKITAVGSK
jgi:c-di-GMP-binding flagellar brake protein YcgR